MHLAAVIQLPKQVFLLTLELHQNTEVRTTHASYLRGVRSGHEDDEDDDDLGQREGWKQGSRPKHHLFPRRKDRDACRTTHEFQGRPIKRSRRA
jgi:hypothetical protein